MQPDRAYDQSNIALFVLTATEACATLHRTCQKRAPAGWTFRTARNLSAAVYTCPLCDQQVPALTEHVLLKPEGDASRRRHAHTDCVLRARRAGELPDRDEWRRGVPSRGGWWRRVLGR